MAEVKAVKNIIVENHFPMCDRKVFDLIDKHGLKARTQIKLFERPGVYILYEGRIPYYIGKADKLWTRLHAHANKTTDQYFLYWDYFQAFVVPDPKHRSELEGVLCAALPTANRSRMKFDVTQVPSLLLKEIRDANRIGVNG
jgi:hypothetical protein